jgi:hypothetical protein
MYVVSILHYNEFTLGPTTHATLVYINNHMGDHDVATSMMWTPYAFCVGLK